MQPNEMRSGNLSDSATGPAYSIVIPCYNSCATIAELFALLDQTFDRMESSYEILAVDDASTDGTTWQAIMAASEGRPVRAFQLTRNFGRTAAVLCGLERARGKSIIIMDDDLQHRPEDIPKLTAQCGHDVVVADFPYAERRHTFSQRLTSWLRDGFDTRILGKPRHIRMSPFIMIRAEIARMMLQSNQQHPYLPALLLHVTRDIVSVRAVHAPRMAGRSGIGFRRRLGMFSNLVFNNSAILLRTVAVAGALFAGLAILAGLYFAMVRLTAPRHVQGWTSIVVIELFMGGLILLSLGIIGEYLARIIRLGERRPTYFVRASYEIDQCFESADPKQALLRSSGRSGSQYV
jgi:glycosyltransferase involved in cell wall biosynthesis